MRLILDVENTVTKRNNRMHLDPFEKDNALVMVGMRSELGEQIITFDHSEGNTTPNGRQIVQEMLDKTTVLVCHNVSHDLVWLWESGFNYDGIVFDTMLSDYVLQRGQKQPSSLEACAERYKLQTQKQDTLKEYFKKGYSVRDIPHAELSEYLSHDLNATEQLADRIFDRLSENKNAGLMDTVNLTNMVAVCLCKIYKNGFTVNYVELEEVKQEFEKEKEALVASLKEQVRELMGDTPINLNSPEQLSWVIYSRKPLDKNDWSSSFNPYMSYESFKDMVMGKSEVVRKKRAMQCGTCLGYGKVRKMKKDGTPFAKMTKCTNCNAEGYLYTATKDIAGLKFSPPNAKWVSYNGFTINKGNIETLEGIARRKENKEAEKFLKNIRRLSALETYLSSFVEGIADHVKLDGRLHVRLLQHRTSTGRFSGADPNMQNMPRGGTFPVKRVFVSRWSDKGGEILEADFAQLEFRVAAFLSQDKTAMREIANGVDVHAYTAKIISDAGQPTTRQEAKAHTFAPLYGATGYGRTPAEAQYYEQFTKKYSGIAQWHTSLGQEAIDTLKIRTPSGREFSFPDVERRSNGSVTYATQLKNYPVQSFATADIVPLVLIKIDEMLNGMQSCIVNSVHDSIVIDIHPDEKDKVLKIMQIINKNLKIIIDNHWKIDFNVPLLLESKIGYNWLDTKDII
jgi:DNA polymerase I-like protein with 3'-5' exonuclease and polymerase domains